MPEEHIYIAIDLKSYYASVECVERGLDPLGANLVVADLSRTEKTICLAVSPSLKAYGIPGRPRLFEVVQRVEEINAERARRAPGGRLTGSSYLAQELAADPGKELAYIVAKPRMAYYIEYSQLIYRIYLRYIAPEDIHVYSIDEVFIDASHYLKIYGMSARELAMTMIRDVLRETGITATAGIGTNLYLCKIAMDIVAKHATPDADGVRIAQLDEMSYRELLWEHKPLTDFWRIGRGYENRLAENGMFTMGDVARCSLENEDLLYRLFGVNAELLIDHAWGWEPCTMDLIKKYRPETNSLSSGQVLPAPYSFEKARVVLREMAEGLALDMVRKGLVCDQVVVSVGYDSESLGDPLTRTRYRGNITSDYYGRAVPRHAHGTENLGRMMSSGKRIEEAALAVFDRCVDPALTIRRLNITVNHVVIEAEYEPETEQYTQLDLFTDYEALEKEKEKEESDLRRERRLQEAVLSIRNRFGKNTIIKGIDLEDGATGIERRGQIGGHRA